MQNVKKRKSNVKSNLLSNIFSFALLAAAFAYFSLNGLDYPTWQKLLMYIGGGVWFLFIAFSTYRCVKTLGSLKKEVDSDGE